MAGIAVAGIALVGGGSDGGGGKKEAKAGKKAGGSAGRSSQSASGEAVASAPTPAGSATPAEPTGSSSADGAALNAQGFDLINQGRPEEAVPILRRAVASFPDGTTDLDYAYALYNLGNALRLSGHPEQAIPVLEKRLQIPDQTSTVAAELARARAEVGTH